MKFLSTVSSMAFAMLAIPAVSAIALPVPGVGPFTNCAASCAAGICDFTVSSVSFTPAVPCIGQKYCLAVSGQLSSDIIEGGALTIIGRYLNKVVYTDTQDLGAVLAAQGTPLPFPASAPGQNTTFTWCRPINPTFFAGIPVQFQFLAMNGNGHTLYCQAAQLVATSC